MVLALFVTQADTQLLHKGSRHPKFGAEAYQSHALGGLPPTNAHQTEMAIRAFQYAERQAGA